MNSFAAPDGVPVLSRGKHRSPRRGACFMEFASFLAGSGGAITRAAPTRCWRSSRGR